MSYLQPKHPSRNVISFVLSTIKVIYFLTPHEPQGHSPCSLQNSFLLSGLFHLAILLCTSSSYSPFSIKDFVNGLTTFLFILILPIIPGDLNVLIQSIEYCTNSSLSFYTPVLTLIPSILVLLFYGDLYSFKPSFSTFSHILYLAKTR